MAGLQVLGDVGERAQVLGVLGRARDVPDLVFGDDVLRRGRRRNGGKNTTEHLRAKRCDDKRDLNDCLPINHYHI